MAVFGMSRGSVCGQEIKAFSRTVLCSQRFDLACITATSLAEVNRPAHDCGGSVVADGRNGENAVAVPIRVAPRIGKPKRCRGLIPDRSMKPSREGSKSFPPKVLG